MASQNRTNTKCPTTKRSYQLRSMMSNRVIKFNYITRYLAQIMEDNEGKVQMKQINAIPF